MKYFKYIMLINTLMLLNSCKGQTSTPDEFLNRNKVEEEAYQNDKLILEEIVSSYLDSVNEKKKPSPKSEILETIIDTVFYSPDGKIALLYIRKKSNPYVKLANPDNEEGIQYSGGCLIGKKKDGNKSFDILKKLKYNLTTVDTKEIASDQLRVLYFREMDYIDGRYNINDKRFWSSSVWD